MCGIKMTWLLDLQGTIDRQETLSRNALGDWMEIEDETDRCILMHVDHHL